MTKVLLTCLLLALPLRAFAFNDGAFSLGIGYYSQNFLNKTAQNPDSSTGFAGAAYYPLNVQYDVSIFDSWFVAPRLSYTLLPRTVDGDASKVTLLNLSFLFGQNFPLSMPTWDWYLGPGILRSTTKGQGGTITLSNGTGTSTFYQPGDSVTAQMVTFQLGTSVELWKSRLALDLIFENLLSSSKRTQSFMISYAYLFGGSDSGSSTRVAKSRSAF